VAWDIISNLSSSVATIHVFHPTSEEPADLQGPTPSNITRYPIPLFHSPSSKTFWDRNFEILSFGLAVVLKHQEIEPIDFLHGFDWPSILPLLTLKILLQKPVFLTLHSSEKWRHPRQRDQISEVVNLEILGYNSSTIFSTVSKPLSIGFQTKETTHILPNGVDPDLFYPQQPKLLSPSGSDPWKIGYYGRLVPEKPLDPVIEVLAELSSSYSFIFDIIGEGPLTAHYSQLVEELGLQDRIAIHPALSHADIPDWLRLLHFVILPAKRETFGLTQIEALSCGLPIVSNLTPSIQHISQINSPIIPLRTNTKAEVHDILESLFSHKRKWEKLQQNAISISNQFSWTSRILPYKQIYSHLTHVSTSDPINTEPFKDNLSLNPSKHFMSTSLYRSLQSILKIGTTPNPDNEHAFNIYCALVERTL
jgi:glycosyltransferase involved in cell wall biosynthesis